MAAQNKTRSTDGDVEAFLAAVAPPQRQADSRAVAAMMERLSGRPPRLWGPSIVGFGAYSYRYDSGREGQAPRIGFSPRKAALTLYVMNGFEEAAPIMARLGRYTTGKSCLYLKKLADVDQGALEDLVTASLAHMDARYPP